MTEAEWTTCTAPREMLSYARDKVSQRKFRLLAVGCCRHVWESLVDERGRQAVIIAERFADMEATEKELSMARSLAHETGWNARPFQDGVEVVLDEGDSRTVARLYFVAFMASPAMRLPNELAMLSTDPDLLLASPNLCRCIFGNPFRPVAFAPAWRTSTATSLAEAIYAERAFDRLPILADALEDAGCTAADVLEHCRQPGEHARGCWVVDLVLAKE